MNARQAGRLAVLTLSAGSAGLVVPPVKGLGASMQQHREFVQEYMVALQDLTFNSKAIITTLTTLAAENRTAASSIAAAVERHLATVSPPQELGDRLSVTVYPLGHSLVPAVSGDL